jgi:glycosyltransferase involved in cell wall biosynthesis
MKISILLITYNHEKYIGTAIDSILMQQCDLQTEIILLDDASSDNTMEVATTKLSGTPNVSLITNKENIGITKNYQKGFSLCKGEFVFVLEGDDYWIDAGKLRKQVNFLESHPSHSMCFHPYIVQEGISSVFNKFSWQNSASSTDSFSIKDLLLNEGLIGNFSVCCYRKTFLDALPPDLFNHLSYDWIINMYMGHFGLLGRINEEMSVYRHAEEATWSNKPVKELLTKTYELIPVYEKLLDYKYSKLFEQKRRMLLEQLTPAENSSTFKQWVPPILLKFFKLLVPPVIIKKINSK